jgi:hypothetical protein
VLLAWQVYSHCCSHVPDQLTLAKQQRLFAVASACVDVGELGYFDRRSMRVRDRETSNYATTTSPSVPRVQAD